MLNPESITTYQRNSNAAAGYCAGKLSQLRVMALLEYNPETGEFKWKVCKNPHVRPGVIAGSPDGSGYITIGIDGRKYRAHRLAWLYTYGSWPIGVIDHINRNKRDNRIVNLRDVNSRVNNINIGETKANRSGRRGVHFEPKSKKYIAQICINYAKTTLGRFDKFEDAVKAREEAEAKTNNLNIIVHRVGCDKERGGPHD